MALAPGFTDSFSEEGLWWLPADPQRQVGGVLSFDPENGTILKLLGLLGGLEMTFGAPSNELVIHGVTKKGKPVTLLRAHRKQRQINAPGIANDTYMALWLAVGIHLTCHDEALFPKSLVRFEGIETWLGHSPFRRDVDWDTRAFTVHAEKSKDEQLAAFGDYTITTSSSLFSSNKPNTNFTIDVFSFVEIAASEPRSIQWHIDNAAKIQGLASLCTGRYLPLLSLELRGPDRSTDPDHPRPAEVQIYVRLRQLDDSSTRSRAPMISATELLAFNANAFERWFEQYETLTPAIHLFFTVAGDRQIYTNVQFLLAIQALEVFHRRTSADRIVAPTAFDALRGKLIAGIPPEAGAKMREKLKGVYQFLNEPSLGQRLKAIVGQLADEFGDAPPAFHKGYLRKLVETRNYYTHFSAELEGRKLDTGDLYWASRRIVLLLTLLFLLRLGIDAANLKAVLHRHEEFSRLWASDGDPF